MRIGFLSWRDSTHPDGGGSEVFVERVAAGLVARGHQVTMVCAAHPGAPARSMVDGVEVLRFGGRLSVYPRAWLWAWRRRRRLDAVVDVINGLPFATPLARRHGVVGLVHHVHRQQWRIIYPGVRGRIGWFLERTLIPRLYGRVPMLTVSDASARDLTALGIPAAHLRVVHNGVDVPAAPVAARAATPRIAVLARLVPHKQIEHAFEAAAVLRREFPDLQLDLIGDGWWRPELERHLATLDAPGLVTWHGHLSDAERDAVLARAWVLVLPSVKEGWGRAIVEAAAQATPCVAYRDAGGPAEAVEHEQTGLLVDRLDDVVGLTDATRRLLASRALVEAYGAAARERARAYTWDAAVSRVEATLTERCRRR